MIVNNITFYEYKAFAQTLILKNRNIPVFEGGDFAGNK